MVAKASAKFVRISPRKVRYVIDLIRKKSVPQALGILNGSPRRAGGIVQKLLNSALDAAEKNLRLKPRDLFISRLTADGGPMMKRFRAASMGRASSILKRTSHIHLELDLLKTASHAPQAFAAASKKEAVKKVSKKLVGAR
jgi:large subunit ribosomal protein L22